MTEEQIKEQIALFLFCLLAARMGCKIKKANVADGTDVEVEHAITYLRGDKMRHFSTGISVEVQLKTTTQKGITHQKNYISFDLEVKNYDDLIFRRNLRLTSKRDTTPLLLVLLVLPNDESQWIHISPDEDKTTLGGALYWYYPSDDLDFTKNRYTERIKIPIGNKFSLEFFDDIFNLPFLFKNRNQ